MGVGGSKQMGHGEETGNDDDLYRHRYGDLRYGVRFSPTPLWLH